MTLAIRPAVGADAPRVLALARPFATSFVVDEEAFHRSYSSVLASATARLLVAEAADGIAAYLLGFDHETFFANGRVAWVEELMVDEPWRRHGIGEALMREFEAWARSRDCRLVALATRRAAAFYRAIGYEESAVYFRRLLDGAAHD